MGFVCLVYHQVSDDPLAQADPLTVSVNCFQAQMNWLARQGYVGVSVGKALAAGASRQDRRQVALTFDDGYQNFYLAAWPVLKELGFGGTLFLVTGRVGEKVNWPGAPAAPLLTWREVQELSAQGVEIAAHGHTHRALDALSQTTVQEELSLARQWLREKLGRIPDGLAYPYGRWSTSVALAVQEAGFRWAVTTRGGVNRRQTPRFELRRTQLTGRDCGKMGRLRLAVKVRTGYAGLMDWRMDLRRIP